MKVLSAFAAIIAVLTPIFLFVALVAEEYAFALFLGLVNLIMVCPAAVMAWLCSSDTDTTKDKTMTDIPKGTYRTITFK